MISVSLFERRSETCHGRAYGLVDRVRDENIELKTEKQVKQFTYMQ